MPITNNRPQNDDKHPIKKGKRSPNTPKNHCIECQSLIPSFHPLFNLVGQAFSEHNKPLGWICKSCLPSCIDEDDESV